MMGFKRPEFRADMTLEEFIRETEEASAKNAVMIAMTATMTADRMNGKSRINEMFSFNKMRYDLELKFLHELQDLRKKVKAQQMLINSYHLAEEKGMIEK